MSRKAGALAATVLFAALAAGGCSDDEPSNATATATRQSMSATPLEQCVQTPRPGQTGAGTFSAFDRATGATVDVSIEHWCREYVALSVPTEPLEAARLTTSYGIFDGHVERRFWEARLDNGRLLATEVEVPAVEAERRIDRQS